MTVLNYCWINNDDIKHWSAPRDLVVQAEDLAAVYQSFLPPFMSIFLPKGNNEWEEVWREPGKFVKTCLDRESEYSQSLQLEQWAEKGS